MNPSVHKVVMVIQDLVTKDKQNIAVCSIDVHYFKEPKDKIDHQTLMNAKKVKDAQKRITIASVQMSLDNNKDFQHQIKSLVSEAIRLKEGK